MVNVLERGASLSSLSSFKAREARLEETSLSSTAQGGGSASQGGGGGGGGSN